MSGNEEASKPFIKKLEHKGLFYIYDVNTNQILEVEKNLYDIIDHLEGDSLPSQKTHLIKTYDISTINSTTENIKQAKEKLGLFSNFRPQKIIFGSNNIDEIKKLYQKNLPQMLLEITRQCNLECSYCRTSGKYAPPSSILEEMNQETCQKALDFFCERSQTDEKSAISFYGGEPLLRSDLIKYAVEYVKEKYRSKQFSFNLTSNGTILNKEIMDLLTKHDISILISLDGPEKINDRYRVFRNGRGTFQEIIKNLNFIKEYDINYYSRKVSITSVLSPPFNFSDDILNFFSTEPTLKEKWQRGKIRSSLIDTRGTSFLEEFDLEDTIKEYDVVHNKFIKQLKRSILEGNLENLNLGSDSIFSILYKLARRTVKHISDYVYPMGACQMGLRRLFVGTNGDFYVCERSGDDYHIGNLIEGFDYKKIAWYYKELEQALDECRYCWALIHCNRCWARLGKIDEFRDKNKEKFCEANKTIVEKAFKLYIELLQEDPNSLKILKNVTIS